MKTVLIDTNIVSFILKKDTRAELYKPYLENRVLAISFMSVAELFQWAAIRNWGERRIAQMEDELKKFIMLPYDLETCRHWGNIRAKCRKAGRPISPQDAWIAATALQHDLSLITHNPDDFKPIDELDIITVLP